MRAQRRWSCCWTAATSSLRLWSHHVITGTMARSSRSLASRETPSPPSWHAKCQSGFTTLSSEPLSERPTVVLLLEGALVSWSLAMDERGGHEYLRGSGRLYWLESSASTWPNSWLRLLPLEELSAKKVSLSCGRAILLAPLRKPFTGCLTPYPGVSTSCFKE
jgi:hypothetical protein